jgi:membrane associated rhomboid family serine protease
MAGLSAVTGSPESQRQIRIAACVLAAGWVIGTIIGKAQARPADISAYTLGGAGFVPVQLVTYSFLHFSVSFAALNLAMLLGISNLASRALSAEGFLRVYSLGAVGGGLLYLLAVRLVGAEERAYTAGPSIALATMLAAMAILRSKARVRFFGAWAAAHPFLVFALLAAATFVEDLVRGLTAAGAEAPPLVLLAFRLSHLAAWVSVDRGVELLGLGVVAWVAAHELALVTAARILIGWELLDRLYWFGRAFVDFRGQDEAFLYFGGRVLSGLLAVTAGVLAGVIYGLVERRAAARTTPAESTARA